MTDKAAPTLSKWPFYAADLLLLAIAGWVMSQAPNPFSFWPLLTVLACTALGAWLSVMPFLLQYKAELKFAESKQLISTVAQINDLKRFSEQIGFATSQWQVVQEQSSKTVVAAREISERMTAEARGFEEFMNKANDSERAHLRLEVDKLRRGEGEWLQLLVRLLDHVYALYSAGVRSGQPNLREQLGQFQTACRDAARRVGLVPFEAQMDEPFNEKTHQLPDGAQAAPGSRVAETIATGFTFQGQLLRGAVVRLHGPAPAVTVDLGQEKPGYETPELALE